MTARAESLRNLRQLIHGGVADDDFLYAFGEYLADHLNPQLVPMGFVMALELAMYDVQKGIDSRTNRPISSRVAGYPPMMYALLRMRFSEIAYAVLPAEFAAQVKAHIEEVRAK